MTEDTRSCLACREDLPAGSFPLRAGRRGPTCDPCLNPGRELWRGRPAQPMTDQRRKSLRAYQLARRAADPEAWRAMRKGQKARRRDRSVEGFDQLDRMLSNGYRLAIRNDPCAYCGDPGAEDDHVIPLALGGTDAWWNLARACRPCNLDKHDRDPFEWRPELMKSPRFALIGIGQM